MDKRICTIGNFTIDDIILYDECKMYLENIGGDVLYSAIGARIWDENPIMIGRIGRSWPASAVADMQRVGIDTSLVKVDFNDIRDWALYEPGGARQFINHIASGGNFDLSIHADEIDPTSLTGADAYHIAPMPTVIQAGIVNRLAELPGLLAWDPHLDHLRQPENNKLAFEMLEKVDLFLPSKEEVGAMVGSTKDLLAIGRRFAACGPKVIAIKMSHDGSLVYDREKDAFYQIPIYPAKTVDPTGAGDSYCGGFISGYLETGDPVLAACYGTISASFVVELTGALHTFDADLSTAKERLEVVKKQIKKL
jgi:sugar/nucleoside kinase (ribokinase family)